jgi:hypothetical protein
MAGYFSPLSILDIGKEINQMHGSGRAFLFLAHSSPRCPALFIAIQPAKHLQPAGSFLCDSAPAPSCSAINDSEERTRLPRETFPNLKAKENNE